MRHMFRLSAVAALFAWAALLGTASAAPQDSFTLQPGGRAVISFEAFCTEFGQIFPDKINGPSGVAADKARAALSYGVAQGLAADGAKALQFQYAIWQSLGTTTSPKGDATAQDVLTKGTAAPATPQGTSVLDAAKAGQVTVTLDSWQAIGPKVAITATATDHFYGSGQLTVVNTSAKALTLYMPVGTTFEPTDPSHQTMTGYATKVDVTNPSLPKTSGADGNPLLLLAAALLLAAGLTVNRVAASRR